MRKCVLTCGIHVAEFLAINCRNSIAVDKSTSQRMYPKKHTPKMG